MRARLSCYVRRLCAARRGIDLLAKLDSGAPGLTGMTQAGAATLARDEETSLVYSIPKAAAETGRVPRFGVSRVARRSHSKVAWVARFAPPRYC